MKHEFKPMTWFVKYFDCNKQAIVDYNILKHRESEIKKMKKNSETKEIFAEKLRSEMMRRFWSKCEWELIIEITEDNHILLKPWVGFYDIEKIIVDVTDDKSFDWKGFAETHISKQRYKNRAKIDVYSQLIYGDNWDKLVTYLWTTRLKYERDNPKFHE